jgi:hypothetical protein
MCFENMPSQSHPCRFAIIDDVKSAKRCRDPKLSDFSPRGNRNERIASPRSKLGFARFLTQSEAGNEVVSLAMYRRSPSGGRRETEWVVHAELKLESSVVDGNCTMAPALRALRLLRSPRTDYPYPKPKRDGERRQIGFVWPGLRGRK